MKFEAKLYCGSLYMGIIAADTLPTLKSIASRKANAYAHVVDRLELLRVGDKDVANTTLYRVNSLRGELVQHGQWETLLGQLRASPTPISNYQEISNLVSEFNGILPIGGRNSDNEIIIVSAGEDCGESFYRLTTAQHNGWIRINTYWESGTTEETYRK